MGAVIPHPSKIEDFCHLPQRGRYRAAGCRPYKRKLGFVGRGFTPAEYVARMKIVGARGESYEQY